MQTNFLRLKMSHLNSIILVCEGYFSQLPMCERDFSQLATHGTNNLIDGKLVQINNLLILVIIYLFSQHFSSVFVWDT